MATLKDVLRLVREEDTGKCDTAADGGEWWATDGQSCLTLQALDSNVKEEKV